MRAVLVLLLFSTGLSCGAIICPRECKCRGKTFKCAVSDLRKLRTILPLNITSLDLSSSSIADVPPGVFENFTSLEFLSLANNSITYLSRDSFRGLHNLRELHLQNNNNLQMDNEMLNEVLRELPSLKILQGNELDGLAPKVINLTRTINISRDTKKESIHCDFHKANPSECINSRIPKCQKALSLNDEEISKFKVQGCAVAQCTIKENQKTLKCYVTGDIGNDTSWSILGNNSAVKLALWTFGLLAVASNFLVLLTLLCNKDARNSALCVFVMNLLLGNILIGSYIVVLTVSDTVTYGNFSRYGEGRWEMSWCVPLFFIKTMGFVLVILSLVLLTIERLLVLVFRAPHHMDRCRSVGYVIESWLVATVIAVVLWTKSSTWGFMCSTLANSKDFNDIDKGVKISLAGICVILIFVYIYILCRRRDKDHVTLTSSEYRTTLRMLILLLSTFLSWAVPYMVLVFMVPVIISVTLSMQTLAISITINACLHPFIYSYDNDHLENLYSTLACKKDACVFLPIVVQGQCYQPAHTKEPTTLEMELEQLPQKRSVESLSVEVRPTIPLSSGSRSLSPVTLFDIKAQAKRGSEVSRAEGAVIIRNKSPTGDYEEDLTVVQVHSVPSSPTTSSRHVRGLLDERSDCGTLSSDTNVTWISSDCPSSAHFRLGDGNSTTSSRASSIPLGKSAASPHIPRRKRLSSVKSGDWERSDEEACNEMDERAKSPVNCLEIQELDTADSTSEKSAKDAESKRDKRMSPVEMLCKVLSPKMKNKRPKTGEGLPNSTKRSLDHGRPQYKRSKSMVLGKDARDVKVKADAIKPLSPVQLRDKKSRSQSREHRQGLFVFPSADEGLESSQSNSSEPTLASSEPCFPERAGSPIEREWEKLKYMVIKPVPTHAKNKGNTKENRKGKLRRSLSEPFRAKVRIYENPVADLDNNNKVSEEEEDARKTTSPTSPTSPTRRLAKLEEGDTVPELPKGLKSKNRISTGSTTSSTRLSNRSLEWDPSSYGEDDYSEDDFMPPPPPPPPKIINGLPPSPPPSPTSSSAGTSDRTEVRLAPPSMSSQYSLDWDPTSVQMRLSIASHDSMAGGCNQYDCTEQVDGHLDDQRQDEPQPLGEPTVA